MCQALFKSPQSLLFSFFLKKKKEKICCVVKKISLSCLKYKLDIEILLE